MPVIQSLRALEILDSRGRPTVQATCALSDGATATVSVPSGRSTGTAEALELRDGDPRRYGGLGCRKAVENVNRVIAPALLDAQIADQPDLDERLLDLDDTPNKSRLGANAILAASLVFARAHARQRGVPLYRHFADLLGIEPKLPGLTINLFSGGKHAEGQVAIQDVLIAPQTATIADGLAMMYAIYQAAAVLIKEKYGMRALTADEGGLAPPALDDETLLADAVAAIERAGYRPGEDAKLALDVASSHFYRDGAYYLQGQILSGGEMVDLLLDWSRRYPLVSIEDGLAEEDWLHWSALCLRMEGTRVLGDDLLCTNPARIRRAIEMKAANALLLKVNQIGTLSEAAAAYRLARSDGWDVVISARSGETEDNWLADLAVGWAGDYIKVGSITQSERLAKYNRLLEIEEERTSFPHLTGIGS
ncbi:MAG: enolase [Caldilineaceae bacterium]|nr:enolase [Caldilineaceae bacterium]